MYGDELRILQYIASKFELMTVSEYARREDISPNGAKDRVKRGKEMSLELKGQTFICG